MPPASNKPPSRKYSFRSTAARRKRERNDGDAAATKNPLDRWKKMPEILPELIVFDLDNTFWTPELYQLRRKPKANHDLWLFEEAHHVLDFCCTKKLRMAIASRASRIDWANELMRDFRIGHDNKQQRSMMDLFEAIEIRSGSKRIHLSNIQESTQVPLRDMVFFDDSLSLNLQDVSKNMGILCGHCPHGLTIDVFQETLHRYSELREKDPYAFMGEIVR